MSVEIIDAIKGIDPDAWVGVSNNNIKKIHWHDGNPNNITEKQIQDKLAELQTAYAAKEYQRNRQPEYPAIGDQLDDLYRKGAFSDEMAAKLKAVKDANPKG